MTPVTRVTLARRATAVALGQQGYENALVAQFAGGRRGVDLRLTEVSGWSERLPGARRVPGRLLDSRLPGARPGLGRLLYGSHGIVHRADLRLPPAAPGREVLTIHDLCFLHFDDEARPPSCAREEAKRASRVITVSEFSAAEIRDSWGISDVTVIPNGVDPEVGRAEPLSDRERRAHQLPDRFVMHSGGCTTRKNLAALAEAWELVVTTVPDVVLVLTGPSDPRREALFGALPRTTRLGHLPRHDQLRLLRSAAAVVVPSTYEGFGLPVLEAMSAGVPVVATRAASLPEIGGDAALLVERDGRAIAEGLLAVLHEDPARRVARGLEIAAGYSWESSADAHALVYASLSP